MAPASRPRPTFGFAFDSPLFSDKTLRLEVVAAADSTPAASRKRPREDLSTDDVTSPDTVKKRQQAFERRDESTLEESAESVDNTKSKGCTGVIVVGNTNPAKQQSIEAKDRNDDKSTDFSRLERVVTEKEGSLAQYAQEEGKTEHAGKCLDNVQKTAVLHVKHIRICSMLLASESQFFHKLFTNGMMESNQNVISLQVLEEELEPVQEIINFIYNGEFSKLEPKKLLTTLVTADKYGVTRAVSECGELLSKSEMTLETALMYLDFPATNSVVLEALGPLKSASGDFVALKFKDAVRHEHELLEMPLSVIRCVFMSSELVVPSENYVYTFLLKWVSENYPDLSQRTGVFRNVLLHLVRFMHMPIEGLVLFAGCPLMADKVLVMTMIVNALMFKANSSYHRVRQWNYEPRVYLTKPVHVSVLHPYAEAIAYMDLNLDDCSRISTAGNTSYINSEVFMFAGYKFFLKVVCSMDPVSNVPATLGLFVGINHTSKPPVNLNLSFAVRQRPSEDFVNKFTYNQTLASGNTFGLLDLLLCPWSQLVSGGSMYVIDGRIHLRVQLKTGAG